MVLSDTARVSQKEQIAEMDEGDYEPTSGIFRYY